MNKYSDKIDQLLTKYSFKELSKEAKELVRSEMSASEYDQIRKILSSTSSINNETIPPLPKGIQVDLRSKLRQRHAEPTASKSMKWLSPVFGMMIGALAMACWFWLSTTNNNLSNAPQITEPVITDTLYVYEKDTVYLTIKSEPKIITREVIKYIEKEATSQLPITLNTPPPNTNEIQNSLQSSYFNKIDLADIVPTKIGTAISEESELMDLLVEMPSDDLK